MKICRNCCTDVNAWMTILNSGCGVEALVVEYCKTTAGMACEEKEHYVKILCLGKINRKITKELKKNGINSEETFLGHGGHRLIVKDRTGADIISVLEKV